MQMISPNDEDVAMEGDIVFTAAADDYDVNDNTIDTEDDNDDYGIERPSYSAEEMNRTGTAFIAIDFQNEFTSPLGELHKDVKPVIEANDMLTRIPRVITKARDAGALVIHAPVIMSATARVSDDDLEVARYGALHGLFTENAWNAEFAECCKPEGDDIILKNRNNFSAFAGTGLRDILKGHSIRRVFLVGFLSDGSIYETARDMFVLLPDIEVFVLTDGSAAKSIEDHNYAITSTLPLYGKCITCREAEDVLTSMRERNMSISRPRILALCGARSNNTVTKLQLENLHITEEDYDIEYLEGPIEVEEVALDLLGLVHGPFYSWFDEDEAKTGDSIIAAVRHVLGFVKANGPFDGVYGFSCGGVIAALAAGVSTDTPLKRKLMADETPGQTNGLHGFASGGAIGALAAGVLTDIGVKMKFLADKAPAGLNASLHSAIDLANTSLHGFKGSYTDLANLNTSLHGAFKGSFTDLASMNRHTDLSNMSPHSVVVKAGPASMQKEVQQTFKSGFGNSSNAIVKSHRAIGDKKSHRAIVQRTKDFHSKNWNSFRRSDPKLGCAANHISLAPLEATDLTKKPFEFAILACTGFSMEDMNALRERAGIALPENPYVEEGNRNLIETNSFHLIGLEDDFKAKSEEVAALFEDAQVMYLPGGHAVGRDASSDNDLCSALKEFAQASGKNPGLHTEKSFHRTSNVSSVAIDPHIQVAQVKLDIERLPEGLLASRGGATILAALKNQPKHRPFLYNARNPNGTNSTYGDIARFICGGDGDLRQLGIKYGEVVAYGAPPGGSAAAALAFLSIGAQTAAAPLAPGMTEPDVLDALHQFNAKHLILFEGVDCPGVESAFLKYTSATIHRARIIGDNRPGMFEFIDPKFKLAEVSKQEPLRNPANGTCLLLRTSGTTARPKGVPLVQRDLINNGAILASSMDLQKTDVCYSVMPLFHIGGISASILCTLTSGGSVCCDGEPFDTGRMVDALAISNPQPTWYSSVPTIHNATVAFLKDQASQDPKFRAYGINSNGTWTKGHSLRMIRSGAAALLGQDGIALAAAYGGVPIYPTYSMSEQMPISQPPAGKTDTLADRPGSVGVPVAASIAIVNHSTLRPQPYGKEGEIAICGPTVLKNYLNNPEANKKSYFFRTENGAPMSRYFLTGDVGVLDGDGFLLLKGRAKELIKKGGEQVSPFEVEEPLLDHPWVQTPVCFAVLSKLYGEEVGCALVLSSEAPEGLEERQIAKAMRQWLKEANLAPAKWPTKWVICKDSDLPKTKTRKYIRIGLAKVLGLEDDDMDAAPGKEIKAKIDWGAISGFRFCLACYVMFMHIGSNESWGAFNNLRGFPWHVHVFFTLGGFSLASPMNPTIGKKFSYFLARIGQMYPMYAAALVFGLANLLIVCRPSTFRPTFHWDGQPDDLLLENGELAPLFCEGTPVTPNSYWASLVLTIVTYIFGLAVTPFWPINWWLGYYLWFSSMYYQCLAVFPAMYNYLYNKLRKNTKKLLLLTIGLLVLNAIIITTAWFTMKDGEGFHHYDEVTGEANSPEAYGNGMRSNVEVLSFYLFGPFWALYFVIGACTAFLYDAYRPAERHSAYIWGWVADGITLVMITISVLMIGQGSSPYGEVPILKFMRPEEANEFTDNASVNRLWDNLVGRIMAPLTTLWIFAVSTGHGWTAAFFGNNFLVESLAPNSYNCFLFHQMVGQWYFAATRNGHMWNWWRYRKEFYWFSPGPCPVEWYEYFLVVGLTVFFSKLMDDRVMPFVSTLYHKVREWIVGPDENEDEDIEEVLCTIIEKMTGIEPNHDSTLEECGLASVGIPVLVGLLNKNFSQRGKVLGITAIDLVAAKTIEDMAEVVASARALAEDRGV